MLFSFSVAFIFAGQKINGMLNQYNQEIKKLEYEAGELLTSLENKPLENTRYHLASRKKDLADTLKKIEKKEENLKASWKTFKAGGICKEAQTIICSITSLNFKLYPLEKFYRSKIEFYQKRLNSYG